MATPKKLRFERPGRYWSDLSPTRRTRKYNSDAFGQSGEGIEEENTVASSSDFATRTPSTPTRMGPIKENCEFTTRFSITPPR